MAKKKAARKPSRPAQSTASDSRSKKSARSVIRKKPSSTPAARGKVASAAKSSTGKSTATTSKAAAGKPSARTSGRTASRPVTERVAPRPVAAPPVLEVPARKKGVRKATLTSGLNDSKTARRLGRSRIPIDAPLDVVFQNDPQAKEAFMFLGIHSIRELEHFNPDELVLRLTGPAKLTVGRIRKILAMNNRCLSGDEEFALEFQELLSRPRE